MDSCERCAALKKLLREKEAYVQELEEQLDRLTDEKLRERGSADDRFGGY